MASWYLRSAKAMPALPQAPLSAGFRLRMRSVRSAAAWNSRKRSDALAYSAAAAWMAGFPAKRHSARLPKRLSAAQADSQ